MKAIYLFALVFMISIVSAFPFQLNTSTGQLIDLNVSDNQTVNLTIYIYNYTTPITLNNYTNVTQNTTCLNCTNDYTNTTNTKLYVYNYTYSISNPNGTYYNKEEIDSINSKFKTIVDSETLNTELNNKIDSINQSIINKVEVKSNKPIWIISILGLILSIISLISLGRTT